MAVLLNNCGNGGFAGCVTDPAEVLGQNRAVADFTDIESVAGFSINLIIYIIYAILLFLLFFYLVIGIYKVVFGEDASALKIAQEAFVRVFFVIIGMVLVTGVLFILFNFLHLAGVENFNEIFWFTQ